MNMIYRSTVKRVNESGKTSPSSRYSEFNQFPHSYHKYSFIAKVLAILAQVLFLFIQFSSFQLNLAQYFLLRSAPKKILPNRN